MAVPRLIRTAHSGLTAGEVAESVGLRLSTAARVVRLPDVRPRGDQR